ncbi:MAG: thioredoxin [Nitrososphaerota archaeon]
MDADDFELERIKARKMRELLSGVKNPKQGVADNVNFPSMPVEVSDMDFDQFVNKYPLVVVDFWAEWCAPCRFMTPVIKELAAEMAGKVVFGKLNVDYNPRTAAKYGIMSIPTFMVFKDGKPVDALVGAMPKQRLKALIMQYVS